MPLGRRDLLLAALGSVRTGLGAEALRVRVAAGSLFVAAPQLRYLSGRPLERLHDGASVWFDFQLSALGERPAAGAAPGAIARALERFAFSYDLWEEKFSVSRSGTTRATVSHLTSALAEAWCLDHLPLPTAPLLPDRPFWLRLEVRAEDPKDRPALLGEPGINLSRLIELFSRPSRSGQASWLVDDGPFRLADLKSTARGNGFG